MSHVNWGIDPVLGVKVEKRIVGRSDDGWGLENGGVGSVSHRGFQQGYHVDRLLKNEQRTERDYEK